MEKQLKLAISLLTVLKGKSGDPRIDSSIENWLNETRKIIDSKK